MAHVVCCAFFSGCVSCARFFHVIILLPSFCHFIHVSFSVYFVILAVEKIYISLTKQILDFIGVCMKSTKPGTKAIYSILIKHSKMKEAQCLDVYLSPKHQVHSFVFNCFMLMNNIQ